MAACRSPCRCCARMNWGGLTGSINRMSAQLRELVGIQGGGRPGWRAGREVGPDPNTIVDDLANSQSQRLDSVAAAIESRCRSAPGMWPATLPTPGPARPEQQARQGEQVLGRARGPWRIAAT